MLYKVIVNNISLNGRTYRKGQEVSGVRFSESQLKDALAAKHVEEVKPEPTLEEPIVETPKKK